jgi:hypothetical protein
MKNQIYFEKDFMETLKTLFERKKNKLNWKFAAYLFET